MSTRKMLTWLGCALVGAAVAAPIVHASNLADRDERRLDAARAQHAQQVERAREAYRATVARANTALERNYRQVIATYERRDAETAESLQAELDELLAGAFEMPAASAGHTAMIESIGEALVDAQGRSAPTEALADREYVMLYFSAGWCGPCRAFTPRLVEFYNSGQAAGRVEVVFVSSDRSEDDMKDYMRQYNMDFPAVPYGRIGASGLRNKYGGRGIPNLVIVDRDGEVVSGSYVDGQYVGPNKVLDDMRRILAGG